VSIVQTTDRRQRLRERLHTLRWTLVIGSGAAFGALWLLIAPAAAAVTSQSSQPAADGSSTQAAQPAYQAPAPQQQVYAPQPYQPPVLRTRRS